MRVIMLGTGPFAVPTFRRLLDSRHRVVALVTRPARVAHGKSPQQTNPMRAFAAGRGLPIHDPADINSTHARAVLASYRPDLLVVCDYGQILSPDTLEISRFGGINLHASLLPKYRGAAPINWAIYHGENETGVTVIHMNPRVDAGPALARASTPIGASETAVELEPRLAELGAPLVLDVVDALEAGTARPIEQDPAQATRAPRLTKQLGQVDWTQPAETLARQIRAFQPWPKTATTWNRPGVGPVRLILEQARALECPGGAPGVVLEAQGDRLVVAAGTGALAIELLQPSGKRAMTAGEFLRGYALRPGDVLGG